MRVEHPAPGGAHVFYVHSGITYALALAAIRDLGVAAPIIIGGRAMAGPGITRTVVDDGMWDIARTLVLLRLIADLAPAGRLIHLYLPHTWMLLGQLVKASARITRFYYLEEGYTSASPLLIDQPQPSPTLCADTLLARLDGCGLTQDLVLNRDALAQLNAQPVRAFDSTHPHYGGAFACTPRAFGAMPRVRRLALAARTLPRAGQLLVVPGLINLYETREDGVARLDQTCQRVLALAAALSAGQSATHPLLLKLHPRDEAELPTTFLAELAARGVGYRQHCLREGLDPNLEPALHHFEHYHICGLTAVAQYVMHFLGPGQLTQHPAFD